MKLTRGVSMILALVLALTLVACAPTTPAPAPSAAAPAPNPAPAESSAPEAPTEKVLKVGVTLYARDQFISILEKGITDAAAAAGVQCDVQDAQNDVQKQLDQVASFVTQKVDVFVVNLVNTDIAEDLIKTVGDTPIVFVNRRPADDVLRAGKDCYVGSQEYDAGKMQADFLADLFKGKGMSEINYILFQGQLGLENTQQRTDSVKIELEKAGIKLNKVFEDTAEWDRAKAMDKMQQILGTAQKFDVVICNNDEMALGVIEALKLANVNPMPPVCGIDATADALQAIKDGTMAMSVFQDAAAQGSKCIEMAQLASEGKLTDKFGWVPFKPVTPANLSEYLK